MKIQKDKKDGKENKDFKDIVTPERSSKRDDEDIDIEKDNEEDEEEEDDDQLVDDSYYSSSGSMGSLTDPDLVAAKSQKASEEQNETNEDIENINVKSSQTLTSMICSTVDLNKSGEDEFIDFQSRISGNFKASHRQLGDAINNSDYKATMFSPRAKLRKISRESFSNIQNSKESKNEKSGDLFSSQEHVDGKKEVGGTKAYNKLLIIQEDIIQAIQTLNYPLFIDLGGTDTQNLNFCKTVN